MRLIKADVLIPRRRQKSLLTLLQTLSPDMPLSSLIEAFSHQGLEITEETGDISAMSLMPKSRATMDQFTAFFESINGHIKAGSTIVLGGEDGEVREFRFGRRFDTHTFRPSYNNWVNLGYHCKDPETQTWCFDKAIALDPDRPMAWHNRTLSLERSHRLHDALESAHAAIEKGTERGYPHFKSLWFLLGQLNIRKFWDDDDPAALDEAARGYRNSLEIDADFHGARYGLACTHALKGDARAALPLIAQVAASDENFKREMARDRDFEALRGMPEFRDIVGWTAPNFRQIYERPTDETHTWHGKAKFTILDIGRLSVRGQFVLCDPSAPEGAAPLSWDAPPGQYKVMIAIARFEEQRDRLDQVACALLMPVRGGRRSPTTTVRWERVIRSGEKHTSFSVTGTHLAFLTPSAHARIETSPARRKTIATRLAEHFYGAEVKFSGGKVVAVEAPEGDHIAWRGLDGLGKTVCLALDLGIL